MASDSTKQTPATFKLRLAVDKFQNRVIYAEADNFFLEALLSYLKIPVGVISRLCDKNSSIGSIDNLYKSVENLDDKYFNTKACKTMLLWPKIVEEHLCSILNIYDSSSTTEVCYVCKQCRISRSSVPIVSYKGVYCECGGEMKNVVCVPKQSPPVLSTSSSKDGLFTKGNMTCMIRDDMAIVPSSLSGFMALIEKLEVDKIEFKEINVDQNEIVKLMQQAFVNKMPFTYTFLRKRNEVVPHSKLIKDYSSAKEAKEAVPVSGGKKGTVVVTLLVEKQKRKVLYAESSQDFVNLLVGFLTLPVGLVMHVLHGGEHLSDIGSIPNLYNSVDHLSSAGCLKGRKYRALLMEPSLPPFFDIKTTLLDVDVETPLDTYSHACCRKECIHYMMPAEFFLFCKFLQCRRRLLPLKYIDPKKHLNHVPSGGGFIDKSKYIITDNLVVTPFSTLSGYSVLAKTGVPLQSVELKTIHIGPEEAKKLLHACLVSKNPLTDAFLH